MKKTYSKPEIVFESFAMSTSIAANCDEITPLPSSSQGCGIPIPGYIIFLANSLCTSVQQDGGYNSICYHNPTDDKMLFNS